VLQDGLCVRRVVWMGGGLLCISNIRYRGRGRSVILVYGETTLWHFISLYLSIDCLSEVGEELGGGRLKFPTELELQGWYK